MQPRDWGQLQAGRFGIPGDATHFRWSLATAQRQKMCDGGQLYDLSDEFDRPGNKPAGAIRIYPVIIDDEKKDEIKPCVCKPSVGGKDPVTFVVVEFKKDDASGDGTVGHLTDLLARAIELTNKPTEVLTDHIDRLQKKIDEQAEYIAENEGGPISQFLNKNPEIVREGCSFVFEIGRAIGAGIKYKVALLQHEAREKKLIDDGDEGGLDVTPKN